MDMLVGILVVLMGVRCRLEEFGRKNAIRLLSGKGIVRHIHGLRERKSGK